jgi:hypothetical protein
VPEAIEVARPGNLRCEVQVVENADHLYTGATAPLSAAVCEWIRRLS